MNNNHPSTAILPVMLYISGNDAAKIESALRVHFAGQFRIAAPTLVSDKERSRQIIKDSVAAEHPQFIVAAGERNLNIDTDLQVLGKNDGFDIEDIESDCLLITKEIYDQALNIAKLATSRITDYLNRRYTKFIYQNN